MVYQAQRKLGVPWEWLGGSAVVAFCGAWAFGPPSVAFWATWLGLFASCGSLAVCILWSDKVIVYPMALLLLFTLAHCISPLYSYWFPIEADFPMTSRFDEAFTFCQAGSAIYLLATLLGFANVPWTKRENTRQMDRRSFAAIHRWSVRAYVGATLVGWISSRTNAIPGSLAAFAYMVGDLRHVALCTLILLGPPRQSVMWFCVGTGISAYEALGGMLGSLINSMVTYAVFLSFAVRRRGALILVGVSVAICVMPLQAVKETYRGVMWNEGANISMLGKLGLIGDSLRDLVGEISRRGHEVVTGPFFMRMNHAKIVDQVFITVPEVEPFAKGETVWEGTMNSFKLRMFASNKARVGGRSSFTRFTQHELYGDTSMDIGFLGEAYANFGVRGGLFYTAVVLGLFGLLLRLAYTKFARSPLCFVWVPFLLSHWHRGEAMLGDSVDYAVKGTIVLALVVWLEPAWRAILTGVPLGGPGGHKPRSSARKPLPAASQAATRQPKGVT